jgi:photosystem II stability/assembly factor-like uncharacterized protein
MRKRSVAFLSLVLVAGCCSVADAQQFDSRQFHDLQWRSIGPYRGGRTRALAGVPSQPNVFYVGAVNGGVWKTTDAGRTWAPIFDAEDTGSIGAIVVAASDPQIIYVGSGEGLHRPDLSVGDGIYKSTDSGRTWKHFGLRDVQQISNMAVDPRNADRVFVAAPGHPYGPNVERGVFRSVDGGATFEKVLYKDENTGAADVKIDPQHPDTVYATLWEAREGPWENAQWNGANGGIFKSRDGGTTWHMLTKGLPDGIVQAYVAIAPSDTKRLFASVATKDQVRLYRSSDGGESWSQATDDTRPATRIGGGDLPVPAIDPKNADVVYMTSIVTWRSSDGGKTWTGIRGAPGGDDYQNIWINPNDSNVILLCSDQGAIVTLNGGETWSSWYNQPTAQMYHANADNAFPYRVCGGQQESGSACVASRSNDGEITFRDWHPVAAEEYGYAVPDPLDPDTVFGGKITRYDRRTSEAQNVAPQLFRTPDYRVVRTEPIVFSPTDLHKLYFAANKLFSTTNGGQSWSVVSADLARKTFDVPASVGKYRDQPTAKPTQRGVIYAVAPSPVEPSVMWAGTDDGLIWLTTDGGGQWNDVTPPQLSAWQKISIIEASHSDAKTAYAAVNTLRLDDLRPHIFRTRDAGKTWAEIVSGIPENENTNAVREDTERKGLLFTATEHAVYVSFDDGDKWQTLRQNMPATSVRDVIIKNDDLVAATHGRGFWILDDITPLRQLKTGAPSDALLFKPQMAYRVRWDTNSDTPLPPDEPAGQNPPDGAIVDYYLPAAAAGPVVLEVHDSAGKLVRSYSSADQVELDISKLNIPTYWLRPPQRLSAEAGMHRFFWDVHYAPVAGIPPQYPIAAVPHNTAPAPTSPWVMPGTYTVVLKVAGHTLEQPMTVTMDPRIKTAREDLQKQFALSMTLYEDLSAVQQAVDHVESLRGQIAELQHKHVKPEVAENLEALDKKLEAIEGGAGGRPAQPAESLRALRSSLEQLMNALQEADVAPTVPETQSTATLHEGADAMLKRWKEIETSDLMATNKKLRQEHLPELKPEVRPPAPTASSDDLDDGA